MVSIPASNPFLIQEKMMGMLSSITKRSFMAWYCKQEILGVLGGLVCRTGYKSMYFRLEIYNWYIADKTDVINFTLPVVVTLYKTSLI